MRRVRQSGAHHIGCAVLDDGRVRCWGSNLQGQLGDQTLIDRRLPVEVDEP